MTARLLSTASLTGKHAPELCPATSTITVHLTATDRLSFAHPGEISLLIRRLEAAREVLAYHQAAVNRHTAPAEYAAGLAEVTHG